MQTLGTTKQTTAKKEESYSINNKYVCTDEVQKGAIVKLKTDGEVTPVTAVGDTPFGVVTVGNQKAGDTVTVTTQYVGVYQGIADGGVTTGDELQATSIDSTTGYTKYKKIAIAGGKITAHALEDIATGENGWVGVLRVFIPAP